ncbi:MAG: saccharopine dehydrogenase NADP-binding domain-containing protein [Hyphomicrobiales bacterium]|nr:saccharopine dehydrogenase NADP-binding domain-containing protein [Hyphomicrobiales bacterium]
MRPFRVIVVGAGRVGMALAKTLAAEPGFSVVLVDGVAEVVDRAHGAGFDAQVCDVLDETPFAALLRGGDAVVAAVPEKLVPQVAATAARLGLAHLDFSDPHSTGLLRREPSAAGPAVLPGCGVSPGLVDDIVAELIAAFDTVDDLVVRVGAIPREPSGRLGYGDIWDVNGLISEYTRPAEAVVDGRATRVTSLGGYETFEWNGRPYEAFVTADGSRSLMDLCRGRVANAAFKTIRHPGHLDHMLFLLDELKLRSRLDMLANLLRNALPHPSEDMVLIHVTARGVVDGAAAERTAVREIASDPSGASALACGAAQYATAQLQALARHAAEANA